MKFIRYITATLIFILACPLSWAAAWDSGSWFTVGLSLIMPTYGGVYWILQELIGSNFIQGLLSWILGFGGAFISATSMYALIEPPKKEIHQPNP